jgi:Insect cuticle protein
MCRTIWMMVCCVVMTSSCLAQAGKRAATGATADTDASQVELFGGYSYWDPHGVVNGIQYKADDQGMIFSGAYFSNQYVGAQIEGERAQQTANDGMRAFSVGPILREPTGQGFTPFAHALVGAAGVTGPNVPTIGGSSFYYNSERWGVALTVGGGMDYATPWFHHRLSLRLFQADFQYTHVNFGPVLATTGGRANIDAARLSMGVVYSLGGRAHQHRR